MKRPDYGPRPDYGYGETTQFTKGPPRFVQISDVGNSPIKECPYCHCVTLADIEVDVDNPRLKTGRGVGRYISCVACAWAGPLLMTAGRPEPTKDS